MSIPLHLLAAVAPLAYWPSVLACYTLPQWALVVAAGAAQKRDERTPVEALVLAWLAWSCLATLLAYDFGASFYGVYGAYYDGLAQTAALYCVYRASVGRDKEQIHEVAAWAGLVCALTGLVQAVLDPGEDRVIGSLGSCIFTAQFLALAAPCAVAVGRPWMLLAYLPCILLTRSRGGLLGLMAALGVWWALKAGRTRRELAWGAALCLAAGFLAVRLAGRPTSALSDQGRGYVWRAAVEAVKDRPVFGWGPEGFFAVAVLYRRPEWSLVYPRQTQGHAHNWLMEAAVTTGVPGAVIWTALCAAAAWLLYRWRERAALATLVGMAVGACFNPTPISIKAAAITVVASALPAVRDAVRGRAVVAVLVWSLAAWGFGRCWYLDRSLRLWGGADGSGRAWDAAKAVKMVYEVDTSAMKTK